MTNELDETGMPVHLLMGVNAQGQGPVMPDEPDYDHSECWCRAGVGCTVVPVTDERRWSVADNRYQEAIKILAEQALADAEAYINSDLHSEHYAAIMVEVRKMQKTIEPSAALVESAHAYLLSHAPEEA